MTKDQSIKIAIFCGGSGSRMWPASRSDKPKQFQPLIGGKSTFEKLVASLEKEFGSVNIFPVARRGFVGHIVSQAPHIPLENIIIEPEGRDTMAAIGFAAMMLDTKFNNPTVISLWSDHLIKNEKNFLKSLRKAAEVSAKTAKIVELGVRATFPSTQLGYIKTGKMIEKIEDLGLFEFIAQIEKPSLEKAQEFLESWEYLWHLGYSVWSTKTLLSYYEEFAPATYKTLLKISELVKNGDSSSKAVKDIFATIEKTSIDLAILEKLGPTERLVISADLGWSDVGTWDVLKDELGELPEDNVSTGKSITVESSDNLLFSTNGNKMLVAVGVKGLIIVDTQDALLVVAKDASGKVKDAVIKLKEEGHEDYL